MISKSLVPSVCPFPPLQITLQCFRGRNRRSTSLMKDRPGLLLRKHATWLLFYPIRVYLKVWLLHEAAVKKFLSVASVKLKHILPACFHSILVQKKKYLLMCSFFFPLSWNIKHPLKWRHDCRIHVSQSKLKKYYPTRSSVEKCWSCCDVRPGNLKPQNRLHTKYLWKIIHFFTCISWLISVIVQ